MIDKENLEKTAAWPFLEAKKILRERKAYIEKKGKIILQLSHRIFPIASQCHLIF